MNLESHPLPTPKAFSVNREEIKCILDAYECIGHGIVGIDERTADILRIKSAVDRKLTDHFKINQAEEKIKELHVSEYQLINNAKEMLLGLNEPCSSRTIILTDIRRNLHFLYSRKLEKAVREFREQFDLLSDKFQKLQHRQLLIVLPPSTSDVELQQIISLGQASTAVFNKP